MSKIKVLAQTDKTVTLRRADFQALLEAAEDNADLAAVEGHRTEEKRLGWDVAKRNYLTRKETERLLDGESPIRVWREKRGVNQRALAEAARVSVSYLAEIEGGKKPGSTSALRRLAEVLAVPMEILASHPTGEPETAFHPITRSEQAATRLEKLAKENTEGSRLAAEARAIVAQWLEIAERDGTRHQVRVAVGALQTLILTKATEWTGRADKLRDHDAAKRTQQISDALEAAWDALGVEYDKL